MRFIPPVGVLICALTQPAWAGLTLSFTDPSGLSAEAEFTLLTSTALELRLRNTSTGVPDGFSNSDQILTGISWDFGPSGVDDFVEIIGGSVAIGSQSYSVNFDTGAYGGDYDVSGEYGYGNGGGSGALPNFVTANQAHATPFGGANLDGPDQLSGPQAGLIASPALVPIGGLGAIQDEIVATLSLSAPITDADILGELGEARVEFGSDAAFITVPEPASLTLLLVLAPAAFRRRCRDLSCGSQRPS